jgi:hypothetical protein
MLILFPMVDPLIPIQLLKLVEIRKGFDFTHPNVETLTAYVTSDIGKFHIIYNTHIMEQEQPKAL